MTVKLEKNGRVMRPLEDRLWSRVDISGPSECWEWQGWRHPSGHGQIGRGRRAEGLAYTHVVAWEAANGRAVPDGMIVRHKCDNPPCCNPSHLESGTKADNTRDMIKRRRMSCGERHATKLCEADVKQIMRRVAEGESQRSVAADLGVSKSLVGLIARGERWKHITSAGS